jgi:two-component system cell cycle sensor histidine kinase/response regulator CckA
VSNQIQERAERDAVSILSGTNPPLGRILVVDDEPELQSVLVEALERHGYDVTGCSSGRSALAELGKRDFDLLLTDLMMPEMDGIALLKAAIEIDPHLISIMLTGQGTIQTAVDAMQVGAFDYLLKPFRLQNLLPVLTRALNTRQLRLENLQLRETVAIHELTQTIAFTLDPQTVLSKLTEAALQQTEADEVSVLLPTADGTEFYVAAARGDRRERLLGERIPFAHSIASWVARERTPVILNGEVKDERFVALWPRPDIRSSVSVPMVVANKLVGVLNVNVINRHRPFALGQMKALSILAGTAASALESASLYTQVKQAEESYHSIFHNAVEGIFRASPTHLLSVNPSMAQILGYESPEEVIEKLKSVSKQLFVDLSTAHAFLSTLEEQGVLQGAEFEAYRKDGDKIWLSLNMRIVRDEHGLEICREGTVEDITERKRAEAERLVIFEIIQGISNSADVEALLTLVHKTIQKVVYAENCFVALYDEQTDTLEMQFFVDQHDATPPPEKLGQSCTARVFRTGKALLLDQGRFDQLVETGEVELLGEPSPSWLGVPLNTPAKTIGVLVVQHYEEDHAYSKRDVDFLSSVGGQIAIAIERKQAAEALATSEAGMRALFAAMTDVIFVLDAEGRYQNIAPTDPTFLYDASTQLLGKTLHEVFPKAEAELFLHHVHRALTEGTAHKVEYCLEIDGTQKWFDGNVAPMTDQSVIWIARDITERKHAEVERDRLNSEIENHRQRLNNIVATVPGVVWEAWGEPSLVSQRIDFVSDYVQSMVGYSVSEWTSKPNFWLSLVHPDDREGAAAVAAEAFATGKGATMEFRWIAKNGREVWVESNFVVVTNESGTPLGLRGVNTDITKRKRTEAALKQSESQLAEAQRLAHIGSWNWDLQNNALTWSEEHYHIYGLERGEFEVNYDDAVSQFIHPEDRELVRREVAKTIETKEPFDFYYRIVRPDGEERIIQSTGNLVSDESGLPVRLFGTAQDVTDRTRIEQDLRQSEERYRDLVENAHDLIYEHDLNGNYTASNKAGERMTGYTLEESLQLNLAETIAPEYFAKGQEMLRRKLAGESVTAYDLVIIGKDGRHVPVEVNTRLVFRDGVAVGVQGIARDITERKRIEEVQARRSAHALFRAHVSAAFATSDTPLSVTLNSCVTAIVEHLGAACARVWNLNREEQMLELQASAGIDIHTVAAHGRVPVGSLMIGKIAAECRPHITNDVQNDSRVSDKDWAVREGLVAFAGYPLRVENRLLGVMALFSREELPEDTLDALASVADLISQGIERRRAEEELREREERYRLLFDSNPQPMWVYDLETLAFLAVNEAAVHHYGYSRKDFLSMTIKDIRPPEDIPALCRSLAGATGATDPATTWTHVKKDGTRIVVEVTSHLLVFDDRRAELILAHDITERLRLEGALLVSEEQLRQSQKLEAIGQLAGGVAHDFNNLLTVIGGYSSILLGKLPQGSPHRGGIEEIKKASDRASSLTRQLLAFSRKQILQPKVLDLNVVVTDIEKMVRRLIGEDIDLLTISSPGLGKVKADPGQIEQVLLNLIVNARDAMPTGGKVTIETRNAVHSEEYAQRHATVPGHFVMLAVSDTGIGMNSDVQPRIFDPFFTTKDSGKGTGLGLATVYGIVKQSGGNIWVYSEVGRGSTFKVYLPRVDEVIAHENSGPLRLMPKGTETVLVVEDEDQVRIILTEILTGQGYNVLSASDGEQALLISQNPDHDIKLLITDVVMPLMSGRELSERVSAVFPNLPILFMSGYTDDAIVRHGLLDEKLNFIQKPFDSTSVARKVREVLDAASNGSLVAG